ncbi:MarR family winged helix-turn-helix transcriptional regulator [Candidatus Stoquefichus massiliensis]|uniref:MarR family winged helix-turn-helix transcriptional regulator n=1 Tax=Candidatus Stoquefichus massiliensis TaxID=1470350 RepID=UPI000488FDF4|nr:MarR family transcriptional regulator [Candidatus Stoquefichus massiliensis]
MSREDMFKDMANERILFGMFFAFGNRLQSAGDTFYKEITCKQFFLLMCLSLFEEAPTVNELADVMGSSHQNVKQIINKLEQKGFLKIVADAKDKRKIRILKTNMMDELKQKYMKQELRFMEQLYQGVSPQDIHITLKTIQQLEKNLIEIKEIGNE